MLKDANNYRKRFEMFGLRVASEKVHEKHICGIDDCENCPLCCITDVTEEDNCNSIDELIDFCIENRITNVYVQPVEFCFDEFSSEITCEFNETLFVNKYNDELKRLRKVYSTIDTDDVDMDFIFEAIIKKFNVAVSERLALMEYRDGHVIANRYKAYYLNKCMTYDWDEINALFRMKEHFYDILNSTMDEMISWMDMEMSLVAKNIAQEREFKVGDIIRLSDALVRGNDYMPMVITEVREDELECIRYDIETEMFSQFTVISPIHFMPAMEGEFPEIEPLSDFVKKKISLVKLLNRIKVSD